jgi:hypothetical protein
LLFFSPFFSSLSLFLLLSLRLGAYLRSSLQNSSPFIWNLWQYSLSLPVNMFNHTKTELRNYTYGMDTLRDYKNGLATAKKQGIALGRQEGIDRLIIA